jgi:hypothetical protein
VCETVTPHGSPAAWIAAEAAVGPVDLVAMTTHGRSGPNRWLFGSLAESVVASSPVPVLPERAWQPVRREPQRSRPGETRTFRHRPVITSWWLTADHQHWAASTPQHPISDAADIGLAWPAQCVRTHQHHVSVDGFGAPVEGGDQRQADHQRRILGQPEQGQAATAVLGQRPGDQLGVGFGRVQRRQLERPAEAWRLFGPMAMSASAVELPTSRKYANGSPALAP